MPSSICLRPLFLAASLAALLSVTSGCGSGSDATPAVRSRFDQFVRHLTRGELDECVKFVDPAHVKANGADKTKNHLRMTKEALTFPHLTENDIRFESVEFTPDGKKATVKHSRQIEKNWSPAPQGTGWQLVDGQWYISI